MFGDSWWTVRIDNASNVVTTILAVDVKAIDGNGNEIPDGCCQANNTLPVDQAFDRSIRAALSGSQHRCSHSTEAFRKAVRDAVVGHFVEGWQRTLTPNQHAVMAYTPANPNYKLHVTIRYQDEAGYHWLRSETGQPMCAYQGPPSITSMP